MVSDINSYTGSKKARLKCHGSKYYFLLGPILLMNFARNSNWMKLKLAVIALLNIRSQHIFAHVTTAKLSCHVQIFKWWLHYQQGESDMKFPLNLNCNVKPGWPYSIVSHYWCVSSNNLVLFALVVCNDGIHPLITGNKALNGNRLF